MLINIGMSNIYLKVTKLTFCKLRFCKFTKFVSRSVLGELQVTQILLNFYNFLQFLQLEFVRLGARSGIKTVCGFLTILILKGIMTF